MTTDRFLVTGALGFIGAWTIRCLVRQGVPVVAFDVAAAPRRLRMLMTPEELAAVEVLHGDITDLDALYRTLESRHVDRVVHLAALQVPAARADPPLGARVNVVGTVNVFEAVRRLDGQVRQVVYTGSVGMFAASDADGRTGRLSADAAAHPLNHYGVYKLANEGTARVYWLENGISSVGIRPMTVYGPGRDFGVTSSPTKAILAAVLGRRYTIGFGGRTLFQYASDVAETLVAAARSSLDGARTFNLGGTVAGVPEFITELDAIVPGAASRIDSTGEPLPFPEEIDTEEIGRALGTVPITSLHDGIAQTVAFFERQRSAGTLIPAEHGLEELTATPA
jgi:UDP-glucuronate 4-epimerase